MKLSTALRMVQISITDLIRAQFPTPIILQANYISCGGVFIPREEFNDMLNIGNPDTIKKYKEAVKEGKRFRQLIHWPHI